MMSAPYPFPTVTETRAAELGVFVGLYGSAMTEDLTTYRQAFYSQMGERFDQFESMRTLGPAFRRDGNVVVTTTRAAAEHVYRNPQIYSSRFGPIGGAHRPLIPIEIDPPDHKLYRRLFDPMFAPRVIASLEPVIRTLVNDLIDGFIDDGGCVFDSAFATPLPTQVFLKLMGLPLEDAGMLLEFKDGILRPGYREGIDPADTVAVQALNQSIVARTYAYFQKLIDDRRADAARDDVMAQVIAGQIDGRRLTDDEILDACFLLLIAGLDTITNSLTLFYHQFANRPDLRAEIGTNPDVIPSAVEELLRWETPTPQVFRVATADDQVCGVEVKAGDLVIIDIGAANTDPAFQSDAGELHFDREPNPHFSFTAGIHRCSGSHLARQELRIALQEWHRRIPDYRITAGTELIWPPGLRSVENLVLEWS
jgi:cytochrome P450